MQSTLRSAAAKSKRSIYSLQIFRQAQRRTVTNLGPCDTPEQYQEAKADAYKALTLAGYNPKYFWEQPIVWGDHDTFQHVNNVSYVRFFESSRVHWMRHLGHQLGGPSAADSLIRGEGVSLILKSIDVRYRRPVTYPDTLLIAHRPVQPTDGQRPDPSALNLEASAYSLGQRAIVTLTKEVVVWYDYDTLKKCIPEDRYLQAVWHTGVASSS
ncbi:HotDog domain-containing protein [Desarmillaria tabescens]|uniref:HotDog domain-containing protein n=1 Tax=Armillaria tabescens TaxID=1929756 RepID=A0AA39K9H6_ARMTA|nr:HotDog domain-containing protein [Desarmillaria tabescens]KAK0455709.1 HotDog domain-containing protein [Desarmillaria tabescens]